MLHVQEVAPSEGGGGHAFIAGLPSAGRGSRRRSASLVRQIGRRREVGLGTSTTDDYGACTKSGPGFGLDGALQGAR